MTLANQFYQGKRILVTGGAGYLATNLVALLRDVDCHIIRLDRPGRQPVQVSGKAHIQDVEGDIRDFNIWESILPGAEVVFHLAAQTSVYVAEQDPSADLEVNVLPMLRLLETSRQKGWRPIIVFAGTVTEAGLPTCLPVDETHPDHPITVYDLHKWMVENYLKHYVQEGMARGAVLRLANVYGPGPKSSGAGRGVLNMMIRKALKGETLTVYGKGDCLRDYVYVQDVVRAFLLAGASVESVNGQYFVIGSGQGHTLVEAFNLVADRVALRTGRRVPVVHVEPPTPQALIEARDFVADSSRFARATGWQASCSLSTGIDRTIESFLQSLPVLVEVEAGKNDEAAERGG